MVSLTELRMTPPQMAAFVDAALQAPHPLSFFDAAVSAFRLVGRQADSTTSAWIGCLYAEGEIELLMSLRASWRRGEDRCPKMAARHALRCQP